MSRETSAGDAINSRVTAPEARRGVSLSTAAMLPSSDQLTLVP